MGQYADDIIDGLCDYSGDYTYKDIAKTQRSERYVKDTPAEANIRAVRKELAILIQEKMANKDCQAINHARQEINRKYGKGWRERGLVSNSNNQWKPLSEYK